MPIYEFRCNACRRTVSVFQRSMKTAVAATCSHCGGADLTRLVSTFAFHRSASDDFGDDDLDEAALMEGLDENDPQSVARWARKMSDKLGEDLGPEFDEMVGRMERGEDLDEDEGEAFGDDGLDDELA
jgi:putative FmdB family regulatory protein